jgi:ATP-dependent exoDNAse (exonuclease V) beta subunit
LPGAKLTDFLSKINLDNDRDDDDIEAKSGVCLITMHAAKGLEFPQVYIVGVEEGLMPHSRSVDEGNLDEERRLFYVAMTRAKNHLHVFAIKGKTTSFADEILPPPEPPKSATPSKPRYGIDQFRVEQEKREREKAEINRKVTEELKRRQEEQIRIAEEQRRVAEEQRKAEEEAKHAAEAAAAQQRFGEIRNRSFQTEEMVIDSAGNRWLQCERCSEIKRKDDFSLIGRRNRPSIGICTDCARKLN